MAVPTYTEFMPPLLKLTADGKDHHIRKAADVLADQFGLTDEDRDERLPSGGVVFLSRVSWASVYLRKAGLLERPSRAIYRITSLGREFLLKHPNGFGNDELMALPLFREFRESAKTDTKRAPKSNDLDESANAERDVAALTPDEQIDEIYRLRRRETARELLEIVKSCDPAFFEQLVVDLLVAMGYGGSIPDAGQSVGRSGDGGIDGIIDEDKLGLDKIYIQAKRWESTVGRPVVQGFAGSLEGVRARKGVFITTSGYSAEARDYVKQIEKRIILIDGPQLAELMIDHGVGVSPVKTYTIHRVDHDYFELE